MTAKKKGYELTPLDDGPRSRCRRWGIRVSVGYDPVTGKRLRPYETFEGTEREADLRAMAIKVQHGIFTPTGMTVGEFFVGMYLPWAESRIRVGSYDGGPRDRDRITRETYARYEQIVRLYIVPLFGDVGLADIKPYFIESRLNSIERLGARRDVYKTLRQGYRKARAWNIVQTVPTEAVPMPKYDAPPKNTAKSDEIFGIIDAFGPDDWDVMLAAAIGFGVGMRRSEMCAIDKEEIDWSVSSDGILGAYHIWRGYHWRGGAGWFEPPKSVESDRTVLFPRWLGEIILPYAEGEGPLLTHRGERTHPDRISRVWREVTMGNGLEVDMPFKNTRHSCGTILVREKKLPAADVQQLFGHSTLVVTTDFYVQSGIESVERAAIAMSDVRRPIVQDCPKLHENGRNDGDESD